jgi:tripartite-type tricarboxylate transporter receptor subunit TctC
MIRSARLISALMACCILVFGTTAAKAAYPDRPVHFILGFSVGGGMDILARVVAQKLAQKWGQPVIVENRVGASGSIAADVVAHAAPDGYSILWVATSHTVNSTLVKTHYDPIKSFSAITEAVQTPDLLVVNSSLPVKTLKDFIALAKSKPGQLNYGSSGVGTAPFLEMETLKKQAGINLIHIAYKGGGDVVTALMGGEIQAYFAVSSTVAGQIKSGHLRPLAVNADSRYSGFPDVPTVAEAAGFDHFDASGASWLGMLAPANTPKEIVDKLNKDVSEVLHSADMQPRLVSFGMIPIGNSPAEFTQMMVRDITKWAPLLKAATVK